MASGSSSDEQGIVGINVTPLVDITLVLLIIFMVTAKLIVSGAMPLDLPKAAHGTEVQVVFSINLDRDGQMFVEGNKLDDAGLTRAASSALAKTADLRTVIAASEAVPHGNVIHVLDVLRGVGITKVAFGVAPQTRTPR